MTSLHARITLAPLRAKSKAVSRPIPELAPVIMTVLPVNLFELVQTPNVIIKKALNAPKAEPIMMKICKRRDRSQKNDSMIDDWNFGRSFEN